MKKDVFISYQSADSEFAHALYKELESLGLSCWIAPEDILPGKNWAEAIVEAVETTRFMAMVFSSSTQNTPKQVLKELYVADEYNEAIVPIMLEDIQLQADFQFHLAGKQRINTFMYSNNAVKETARQIILYRESKFSQDTQIPHRTPVNLTPAKVLPPKSWSASLFVRLYTSKTIALATGVLVFVIVASFAVNAIFSHDKGPLSAQPAVNAPLPEPTQANPPKSNSLDEPNTSAPSSKNPIVVAPSLTQVEPTTQPEPVMSASGADTSRESTTKLDQNTDLSKQRAPDLTNANNTAAKPNVEKALTSQKIPTGTKVRHQPPAPTSSEKKSTEPKTKNSEIDTKRPNSENTPIGSLFRVPN